jgi:hypothetical protein
LSPQKVHHGKPLQDLREVPAGYTRAPGEFLGSDPTVDASQMHHGLDGVTSRQGDHDILYSCMEDMTVAIGQRLGADEYRMV